MRDTENERSCTCGDCGCHRGEYPFADKTSTTRHILGSVDNSIDLYVSTPAKTKWIFLEEEIDNGKETAE